MSDENVVADALAQLEALIPADAWIEVSGGDHDDGVSVTGNVAGLARLSQILLRCALDTPEAREYRLLGAAANDLRGLVARGSELSLASVELLLERPPDRERGWHVPDKLALFGCGLLALVIGLIFLVGLADVTGFIGTK